MLSILVYYMLFHFCYFYFCFSTFLFCIVFSVAWQMKVLENLMLYWSLTGTLNSIFSAAFFKRNKQKNPQHSNIAVCPAIAAWIHLSSHLRLSGTTPTEAYSTTNPPQGGVNSPAAWMRPPAGAHLSKGLSINDQEEPDSSWQLSLCRSKTNNTSVIH